MIENVKYDDKGLVPAVVQDYKTGEVLMLAYMNEFALRKTVETNETYFYSRSRNELWHKGGTSGNFQYVKEIYFDCDMDAVLVKVEQKGGACHTGSKSCFFNKLEESGTMKYEILYKLVDVIRDRKSNPVKGSYTSYLFEKGIDKILKKVGEESAEVIIASKNTDPGELIYEMADLVYHCLVLLNEKDVELDLIFDELEARFKD